MSPRPQAAHLQTYPPALGRRVVSRACWALWDHLFGVASLGAVTGCVALALPGLFYGIGPFLPPGVPLLIGAVATGVVILLFLAWLWSGFREYARAAVLRDGGKVEDFLVGIRSPQWALRCAGGLIGLVLVVGANVLFYTAVAGNGELSQGMRLGAATAGMLVAWMSAVVLFFFWAGISDSGEIPPSGPLAAVRRGFELVMLAPRAWFAALLTVMSLNVLFVISILGIVYIVPIAAMFGVAASSVVEQHREFLLKARKELGSEGDLGSLQQRAAELWAAHDAKQPVRTLRQLLRPWEY